MSARRTRTEKVVVAVTVIIAWGALALVTYALIRG